MLCKDDLLAVQAAGEGYSELLLQRQVLFRCYTAIKKEAAGTCQNGCSDAQEIPSAKQLLEPWVGLEMAQ